MTTTTLVSQDSTYRGFHVRVVRDEGGYWHWIVVNLRNPSERVRSRPRGGTWFGHWTRRGALYAARKTVRLMQQ